MSAFCFQVFSKLAHVREKKNLMKDNFGNEKEKPCLSMPRGLRKLLDEDFILGAELKV